MAIEGMEGRRGLSFLDEGVLECLLRKAQVAFQGILVEGWGDRDSPVYQVLRKGVFLGKLGGKSSRSKETRSYRFLAKTYQRREGLYLRWPPKRTRIRVDWEHT